MYRESQHYLRLIPGFQVLGLKTVALLKSPCDPCTLFIVHETPTALCKEAGIDGEHHVGTVFRRGTPGLLFP